MKKWILLLDGMNINQQCIFEETNRKFISWNSGREKKKEEKVKDMAYVVFLRCFAG